MPRPGGANIGETCYAFDTPNQRQARRRPVIILGKCQTGDDRAACPKICFWTSPCRSERAECVGVQSCSTGLEAPSRVESGEWRERTRFSAHGCFTISRTTAALHLDASWFSWGLHPRMRIIPWPEEDGKRPRRRILNPRSLSKAGLACVQGMYKEPIKFAVPAFRVQARDRIKHSSGTRWCSGGAMSAMSTVPNDAIGSP